MNKKYFLILFLLLTLSCKVFCCGNEYGYTLDGKRIFTEYFFLSEWMRHFDTIKINKKLSDLELKVKNGSADYKTWSDIAVNLMMLGKADSSVKILKPIILKHPNEYNINANLGTAYELTGKLDSALKYISKGYELNPNSHYGSEWIHIKILEAKLKEKRNPGWLDKNPIIKVEELLEKLDSTKLPYSLNKVNHDFFFQIRTRAPFTPAPDKVISNLLVTIGDFNSKVGTFENSLLSYIYAIKFQPTEYLNFKIKDKIKDLNQRRSMQENITELPHIFLQMMKWNKIDPEVLIIGIDDFAEQLDSLHLSKIKRDDSLTLLQNQLDSIKTILEIKINTEVNSPQKSGYSKFIFIGIGVLTGVLLSFLLRKKNN